MKKRDITFAAERELYDLIRSKLTDGMTPDQAADAVFELFHWIEDEWSEMDATQLGDEPGSRVLDRRSLIARIPRDAKERRILPDRTVG